MDASIPVPSWRGTRVMRKTGVAKSAAVTGRGSRARRRPEDAAARSHASVETALAALAHEVRTPLNGILALGELLAASDLPARERGWADAIRSAADHLAQFTSLIVDAGKAGRGRLVPRREVFRPRALA